MGFITGEGSDRVRIKTGFMQPQTVLFGDETLTFSDFFELAINILTNMPLLVDVSDENNIDPLVVFVRWANMLEETDGYIKEGTRIADVKHPANDFRKANDIRKVRVGRYSVALSDFLDTVEYVLTNTDLGQAQISFDADNKPIILPSGESGDPRLRFLKQIKSLRLLKKADDTYFQLSQ